MSKKKEDTKIVESNEQSIEVGNVKESTLSSDAQNLESEQKENQTIDQKLDVIEQESSNVDFDAEVVKGRLEEVRQAETPKKKKKSRIMNTIFLVINIVLMIVIVNGFMKSYGNGLDIPSIIASQGDKLWWLLLGFLLYLIFIACETGVFTSMLKGSTGKRRPYLAYRTAIIGKYYDNITPFSVGGQPFQIIALVKSGVSAGVSTSLPIIKVIVYNLVNTVFIALAFILGMPLVFSTDMLSNFVLLLLNFVAVVGLIFSGVTGILFILIGNGKIVGRGLARFVVKLGYKLRIVKNYRATYNKIMLQVREYQNSMTFLRKNKWVMVKCIFFSLIEILAYYSIPFTVVLAFTSNTEITFMLWFVCLVKFLICNMAAVIIPLPGGTGMMELSFMFVFGTTDLLGANVAVGLLVWRILSYYILILHGFGQTIADNITDAVKNRRLMRKQK